jgi:signal transduction histidine kinase
LAKLLKDVYEDCVPIADAKDIRIFLDRSQEVTIAGDEMRLRQMLLNLIDNAVKYTSSGGQIRLSLEVEGKYARFQVKDTGIGISQEDLPCIFDRFFRVDKARSREMGGSGLGLSIVQWIVNAHQGHIEVASRLGEGSCFTIWLPTDGE